MVLLETQDLSHCPDPLQHFRTLRLPPTSVDDWAEMLNQQYVAGWRLVHIASPGPGPSVAVFEHTHASSGHHG